MLRGVVPALEKHHNVRILDEGCKRRSSSRIAIWRTGSFPTKRSACSTRPARGWRWAQNAIPPAIEDAMRSSTICGAERVLSANRRGRGPRRAAWKHRRKKADRARLADAERALGERARAGHAHPRDAHAAGSDGKAPAAAGGCGTRSRRRRPYEPIRRAYRSRRARRRARATAGRAPLMRVCVDAQIVGEVISGWTGIPSARC
jgi:type VI secretion system protein VasG